MKHTLKIIYASLIFIVLGSCGKSGDGPYFLHTEEGVAYAKEILKEHIGLDRKVISVDFSNRTVLTSDLSQIYKIDTRR